MKSSHAPSAAAIAGYGAPGGLAGYFKGNVQVNGDITVDGGFTNTGDRTINGSLTVNGNITVDGDIFDKSRRLR